VGGGRVDAAGRAVEELSLKTHRGWKPDLTTIMQGSNPCPTPKTINKAGDSRNVEIRSFGQGEKFGQPSLTETTEDSRGTFRSIVHRVGIALRALYKPSNPAPAFKIFPIPDEHLPKCAGCGAQWDNHDTGCYCMWGREPSECEGPND
jgi:hypothetical protein